MSIAVRTGLEPATPGVTGLYSNRLNYRTIPFLSHQATSVAFICDCKGRTFFLICKDF